LLFLDEPFLPEGDGAGVEVVAAAHGQCHRLIGE